MIYGMPHHLHTWWSKITQLGNENFLFKDDITMPGLWRKMTTAIKTLAKCQMG